MHTFPFHRNIGDFSLDFAFSIVVFVFLSLWKEFCENFSLKKRQIACNVKLSAHSGGFPLL